MSEKATRLNVDWMFSAQAEEALRLQPDYPQAQGLLRELSR